MADVLNIPLYYIGFKKNSALEDQLSKVGFTDVHHFQAIDGRKMDPTTLLKDKIIGSRAYNDLVYDRSEKIGISSLGTIGCTLSHMALWKKCVDNNLPFIAIAEDDLYVEKITSKDIKTIQSNLANKNGAFISTDIDPGTQTMIGLHFYFLTNGAAKQLLAHALPIEMQTDSYVGHMNNTRAIRANGYKLGVQSSKDSTTGSGLFGCIKCELPTGNLFYWLILLFIFILIVMAYFLYKTLTKTKVALESCRSSKSAQ